MFDFNNSYYCVMNIIKYLKKLNIILVVDDGIFIFTFVDGTVKRVKQNELEQYLFIKMIEYIKPNFTL